ncbi:hypothetical protein KY338_04925 [Candidatus Woesearchaeota archaeon]|nr:hypothetical protein [Candidatus Woesearchaeota archaeon]MBW3006248.1 hypothetical protein [Candidatus Woesearchaeota archaeon]
MGLKDILAGLIITYATLTPISVLAQETQIVSQVKKELTPHAITYLRLDEYESADLTGSTRFVNLTMSEEDGIVKLCGSLLREENQESSNPLDFVIRKKGDNVDIWTRDSVLGVFSRGDQDDFNLLITDRINQESLSNLRKQQSIEDILLSINPEQFLSQTDAVVKAEGYTACGILALYEGRHWAGNYKKSPEENFRLHTHNLNPRLTQAVCLGRDSSELDLEIQRFFNNYNFRANFYTLEQDHILYLHHFLGDIHDAYFIRMPNKKTEFRGWIPQQSERPKSWGRYIHIKIIYDKDGNIESNTLTTKEDDKKIVLDKPLSESAARSLYRIGAPILDRCIKALE